jgi:hypothetical protein
MISQAGRQTFYDVNSSNTFYTYIESLVQANANAMYPPYPDLVQPACGSSSMPCYFPGANSVRLDAVVQTYLAAAIYYNGNSRNAQVFPHLGATDNNSDWYGGKYEAIYSYVSTPSYYPSAGGTINAPVGLTDYYDDHFIESGFQISCDGNNNCQRHPYGTWGDGDADHGGWNPLITLNAGQGYTYRTDPAGTNAWTSSWCDANGCTALATTTNLGRQRMPMAFAGGESYPFTQRFGTLYLYDNQVRTFGTWAGWCYDPKQAPIAVRNPLSQAIGTCSSSAWTVSYP